MGLSSAIQKKKLPPKATAAPKLTSKHNLHSSRTKDASSGLSNTTTGPCDYNNLSFDIHLFCKDYICTAHVRSNASASQS